MASFALALEAALLGGLVRLDVLDLPLVGFGLFLCRESVRSRPDTPLDRCQASLSLCALSVILGARRFVKLTYKSARQAVYARVFGASFPRRSFGEGRVLQIGAAYHVRKAWAQGFSPACKTSAGLFHSCSSSVGKVGCATQR